MPSVPGDLNCILLNACGAAYNIAPGTCTYIADGVFGPRVPYQGAPKTACGGSNLINAATVGQCPFGIVVAFRGTLPPSESDPDSLLDISNESVEAQTWDVAKEFGEDVWTENFSSFAAAHSLAPGLGYNSGLCGAPR